MSTQQQQRLPRGHSPAPKRPHPDPDPVPPNLRWLRGVLTTVSVLAMVAGVGLIAYALGNNVSYLPAIAVTVAGVVLFAISQRTGLYVSIAERKAARRAAKTTTEPMPDTEPARVVSTGPRPAQRGRVQTPVAADAPVAPDRDVLPADFRYIVGGCRRLRVERVNGLRDAYRELAADTAGPYYQAVDLVRSIAQEREFYAEPGEPGFDDPRNPGLFLAELDGIAGAASAVAAVLLVKDDDDVTPDVFKTVIAPWVAQRLPFLYNGVMYVSDGEGYHKAKEQPQPQPRSGRGRSATPADDPIDLPLSDPGPADTQQQAPAQPARPQPQPEQQPQPAHPTPAAAPAPAGNPESQPAAAAPPGFPFTVGDLAHAAELVVSSQLASVAMVQRKMRLGYGIASAMMDRLATLGIVKQKINGDGFDVVENAQQAGDIAKWILDNEGGQLQ